MEYLGQKQLMNTARQAGGSAGTQSEGALIYSGGTPSATTAVEEWSSTSNTTKTIDTD